MKDKEPQIGEKIEYRLFDAKNKEHWLKGRIHGIRRYEEPSGIIKSVMYLVDTGRVHPDHKNRPDPQPEQLELPAEHIKAR